MINEKGLVAHYTTAEKLSKILTTATIKPGSVCDLNDPRESSMGWIKIGRDFDKHREVRRDAIKIYKDKVGRQLQLFCTAMPRLETPAGCSCPIETSIYGRPRMWAQYGEGFKGGCVLFDKERLNDAINLSYSKEFVIPDPVVYVDWLPIVEGGVVSIEIGRDWQTPDENVIWKEINHNSKLHSLYFKKGKDWIEENEYRWLAFSVSSEPKLVNIRDAIHAVVLGSKFPVPYEGFESEDYEKIKEYCRSLKCSCYALSYTHPQYDLITICEAQQNALFEPGVIG